MPANLLLLLLLESCWHLPLDARMLLLGMLQVGVVAVFAVFVAVDGKGVE